MAHLSAVDELEWVCDCIQKDVGMSWYQVTLVCRQVGVDQVQGHVGDLQGQGMWVSRLLGCQLVVVAGHANPIGEESVGDRQWWFLALECLVSLLVGSSTCKRRW